MKKVIIGVVVLLVLLGAGGAIAYKVMVLDKEAAETAAAPPAVATETPKPEEKKPAEPKPEEKKKDRKDRKESAADRNKPHDTDGQVDELIKAGNASLTTDPMKADQSFQEALKIARTDEQQVRAWHGRIMAAKIMGSGEIEHMAGTNMLKLATTDKMKANAYEGIAHGSVVRQNYMEAVEAYRQAGECYQKAGDYKLVCSIAVDLSRVLRRYIADFQGADQALKRAWEAVDKSGVEEKRAKYMKWSLCLEQADNCRLMGDSAGQIRWNHEAAKYNPDWKQNAAIIERSLTAPAPESGEAAGPESGEAEPAAPEEAEETSGAAEAG